MCSKTGHRHHRVTLTRYQTLTPDAFYATANLPRRTPDNALYVVRLCPEHHLSSNKMCWELCFGSTITTIRAYARDLQVLFPVGMRDGWDLDHAQHLRILKQVQAYFIPSFSWAAMPCMFLAQAGDRRNPHITSTNMRAHTARMQLTVWLARPIFKPDVSVILDMLQSSPIWKTPFWRALHSNGMP